MPTRAKSPTTETPPDSASMTSTPTSKATRKTTRKQPGGRNSLLLPRQLPQAKRRPAKTGPVHAGTFPDANIVTDVGGGLNFQRKGLVSLLERLHRGDKLQIVVAHRDRLARFGFELIQWMAEQNGGEILVLDNTDHSPQQELTEDILAILHTFSCRLHGLRRYRNQIQADKDLSDSGPA
ncbi:Putative resolvase R771, partial [Geodia barretti]